MNIFKKTKKKAVNAFIINPIHKNFLAVQVESFQFSNV